MKNVEWLYRELPGLVEIGVVSDETAGKIRAHYGELKDNRSWVALMVFGVLGAVLIGLGVISLIAHNWEQWSRATRAVICFSVLGLSQLLALWVLVKRPLSGAWKEGSAVFLSLMVGACISLVGQTYNIPGDIEDLVFIWMLLIVPLVYIFDSALTAAIFVAGVTSWGGCVYQEHLKALWVWPFLALAIPHFIRIIKNENYKIRCAILSFVLAISGIFCSVMTLGKTWSGEWIIILSSLAALYYALGTKSWDSQVKGWQRPLSVIGGLGVFVMMYLLTYKGIWKDMVYSSYFYNSYSLIPFAEFLDHGFVFLLTGTTLIFNFEYFRDNDHKKITFGLLPLFVLMGFALGPQLAGMTAWVFNIYMLATSLVWIMTGIKKENIGTVNGGMLMLALLIITRFFDSDLGFVIKGLVFIIVGAGFLGGNFYMLRKKSQGGLK